MGWPVPSNSHDKKLVQMRENGKSFDFLRIVEELSRADGSAGWCATGGGASPSSRIAWLSFSGAHFDEEPEIRLDLRRPAGHRGADGCGSALDVFRDGRIAVEPVDVFSLDAEAADLVEPAFGALDQFVNFALKIVVVHRQ
jgi:hypothetical protein